MIMEGGGFCGLSMMPNNRVIAADREQILFRLTVGTVLEVPY